MDIVVDTRNHLPLLRVDQHPTSQYLEEVSIDDGERRVCLQPGLLLPWHQLLLLVQPRHNLLLDVGEVHRLHLGPVEITDPHLVEVDQ